MSIPYWREVKYTDEGCSEFQCLSCYKTWESRTPPGRHTYKCGKCTYCVTGVYKCGDWECHGKEEYRICIPEFILCPYCGIKWVGGKVRPQTHRKSIIEKLIDNLPLERKYPKNKYWVILSRNRRDPIFRERFKFYYEKTSREYVLQRVRDFIADAIHEVNSTKHLLIYKDEPTPTPAEIKNWFKIQIKYQ